MSRSSTAQVIPLNEYLEPDFDPDTLSVSQLLVILGFHNIAYPTPYSKPKLVRLFNEQVKQRAPRLKKERSRRENSTTRHDGRRKTPARSLSRRLSHSPEARPESLKRRRYSAAPRLGRPSEQAPNIATPVIEEEDESEDKGFSFRKLRRTKTRAHFSASGNRRASQSGDSGRNDYNVVSSSRAGYSPADSSSGKARLRKSGTASRKFQRSVTVPPESSLKKVHRSPSPPFNLDFVAVPRFASPAASDDSMSTTTASHSPTCLQDIIQARRVQNLEELRLLLSLPDAGLTILLSLEDACIPTVVQLLHSEGLPAATNLSVDENYQRRCMKALRAVVKKYKILPPSLMKTVTREGEYPLGGGGFADIWKGQCDNQVVCLKVLRFYVEANQKKKESAVSAFCQEAMVWTHLCHPNILPCLGVNTEVFHPACCLISPWMVNGDVITFLERNPSHDRLKTIFEIASGLAYLHSLRPVVIHGDIKGINILVDEYHNCRLADFGLAAVLETQVVKNVTSGAVRGSVHWMAPELFMSSSSVSDKRPADIYAYGCTVFEIMTGHPPFSNFNDYQVILEVLKGTRPPKPTFSWFLGNVWDLVESCWHSDSGKRPCAVEIEQGLERLLSLRDEESKCVGDVPS